MNEENSLKPGMPSPEELFELAFNYRYHECLLGFLIAQSAGKISFIDNVYTLHGVVRGAYVQIMTGGGVTGVIHDAIMNAAGVAYRMLKKLAARDSVPTEFYRAAHMWGGMLERFSRVDEALKVIDEAFEMGAAGMPYMKNALLLLRIRLLQSTGRIDEAFALAGPMVDRPFLLNDLRQIAELNNLYGSLCKQTGRLDAFDHVAWRNLRIIRGNSGLRKRSMDLLAEVYGGVEALLARMENYSGERTVAFVAWCSQFIKNDRRGHKLADDLEGWIDAYLEAQNYRGPNAQHLNYFTGPAPRPGTDGRILITRAMGGIGDLLMMTPGIRALHEADPDKEIVIAVPRDLVPLFDGNPHCTATAIDAEGLDARDFGVWYNLSDCPASREECRTAPHVTQSRIDSFAAGMGINDDILQRMNHRPVYAMREGEHEAAREFLRQHGDGPYVAVQLKTADGYRDYPHLETVVKSLAEASDVFVFNDRIFPAFELKRVTKVYGMELRRALAIVGQCDVVLAPDSSFVHVAGALDIPCISLFGPIDGKVRTSYYPQCRTLDAASTWPCVPCWRNEQTPCRVTMGRRSQCMSDIDPRQVVRSVLTVLESQGLLQK